MAPNNKDMRRAELDQRALAVVPYQEPISKGDNPEFSSTLSSTMPMAAMFTRNKFVGWYGFSLFRFGLGYDESSECSRKRKMGCEICADWVNCRAGVVFSIQNWLGESAETKKNGTPGYFNVGLSVMALAVTYMPLFMPPPDRSAAGTATGAPAPVPPA
ncbi:hypothetical protein CRV24_004553 [Beauveria bassiana]|nr:hypothetical protein CRV24_004553 [Beauveria bassiana]